jgi:MerR family transcriptional regulator/heat shock protein HspR
VTTEKTVRGEDPADDHGVFGISVAAEMVGTGVQNLRLYERRGLLEPSRTSGGTRLYSRNDVARLDRITELLDAGLNLAGVAMVLDLQDDLTEVRRERDGLRDGPAAADGTAPG